MLEKDAIDFLLFSYLGVRLDDLKAPSEEKKEEIIVKCAKRAYMDLRRTLKFRERSSDNSFSAKERREIEKKHQKFCDHICRNVIKEALKELLEKPEQDFDTWHENACSCMVNAVEKYVDDGDGLAVLIINPNGKKQTCKDKKREDKIFYYGQAQKWLNMTIKYMWFLGLWKEQMDLLLPVLHVPVDSYIVKKVWSYNDNRLKEALPLVKECKIKVGDEYSEDKVIPWSKWEGEEYRKFQKSLRKWCVEPPIKWEGQVWIDIASSD